MNKKILKKLEKIRLLISDVDGVLTDGGMYYSEKGEILKKFNAKDGMGVEILLRSKEDLKLKLRQLTLEHSTKNHNFKKSVKNFKFHLQKLHT